MERPTRAAASKIANLNEENLANMASMVTDPQTLSPLDPVIEGAQPQACPCYNGETNNMATFIERLEMKVDQMNENLQKSFQDLEKKLETKIDESISKKLDDIRQGLLNELNSNITKKVEEEVLKIKKEIQVEMRQELQRIENESKQRDQKLQEQYHDVRQSVNEQEEAIYSKKIILCGNAIPEFREDESPLTIAQSVIHDNLRIRVNGCITNAIRFEPPPTAGGRRPNPNPKKILVEVNNIGTKRHIVDTALQVKSRDLFINELLPKRTNEMFYKLRKLKKERKIAVLYTKDGVIKVRKTKEGTLYKLRTKGDMDDFLQNAGIQ